MLLHCSARCSTLLQVSGKKDVAPLWMLALAKLHVVCQINFPIVLLPLTLQIQHLNSVWYSIWKQLQS